VLRVYFRKRYIYSFKLLTFHIHAKEEEGEEEEEEEEEKESACSSML